MFYQIPHYIPTEREPDCILGIHYSPFRKGDGPNAYYGPTPDEEAEVELEEIWLGSILLPTHHRFYKLFDDPAILFDLVEQYLEPEYYED